MNQRKSILWFNAVSAIVIITLAATILPIGTIVLDAQAQNADTSQRVRYYLIQAIQALDSGDDVEAIKQLQLATDQMGTPTGISVQANDVGVSSGGRGESDTDESSNDGERDDEGEESEEGPGEDADEPGDTDENDEED